MRLSFSTANYVGRANGYRPELISWSAAERITYEQTSLDDFAALCRDIVAAGFDAIDLWKAHAWPSTLTPESADELLGLLRSYDLEAVSYAGELDANAPAMLRAARLLGIKLVCGELDAAVAHQVAIQARQRGVRVGIENYTERHPDEIRAKIGFDDDILGACVDTGAWLMQGYNPAHAIRALGSQVWHVHLKDIAALGSSTQVPLGSGILDLEAVLAALRAINYNGILTIEQETVHADPTADVISGKALVEHLLAM